MMDKLIQIRRATEPLELLKLVKKVKNELSSEVMITELPQHLQQSIVDEMKSMKHEISFTDDEIIACDASPMSVVFLACHRVLKEICQLAELNSNSIFLKIKKFEDALTKHGNHRCSLESAKRLDEKGESFYNPHIPRVIRELRELELVEESEGACVISIEGVISFPLNVVKSDDGFN
ncbi:hypothetical protein CsatA_001471 [Cannabis sativa]